MLWQWKTGDNFFWLQIREDALEGSEVTRLTQSWRRRGEKRFWARDTLYSVDQWAHGKSEEERGEIRHPQTKATRSFTESKKSVFCWKAQSGNMQTHLTFCELLPLSCFVSPLTYPLSIHCCFLNPIWAPCMFVVGYFKYFPSAASKTPIYLTAASRAEKIWHRHEADSYFMPC